MLLDGGVRENTATLPPRFGYRSRVEAVKRIVVTPAPGVAQEENPKTLYRTKRSAGATEYAAKWPLSSATKTLQLEST
jgi:hypothetical protein